MSDFYTKIEKLARRVHNLQHAQAIVGWDEAVMMPEGGSDSRAGAMAELNVLVHETFSNPAIADWIQGAEPEVTSSGDPWKVANLREFKRTWQQTTCMPADLVEAKTLACMKSEQSWREMRGKNDWKGFRPLMEEVIRLTREEASIRSEITGLSPYDSLMEQYTPGCRTKAVDEVFADLKKFLPEFVRAVVEKQRSETLVRPEGPFPVARQRELGLELMKAVGFDFNHGRLDVSHHPFCGGVPRDVRLTTRYNEKDFAPGMMGVLHETGHAKYEQGLPVAWITQPVSQARGMALHESQSLFLEMQVSRSQEFLRFAAPILKKHVGPHTSVASLEPENLFLYFTRVKPSFIRVDADEATYPSHVILRYELEKAMIAGKLEVADLPEAWDTGMKAALGLSTEGNYKDGCMQDVHWPAGLVGYFPSYTLGAIIAAQLFASLKRDLPGIHGDIETGDFSGMNEWLKKRVWGMGSFLTADDLLKGATGEALNAEHFKNHLRRRYLDS